MPTQLIIKVHPDDRVEVKVEGLTVRDHDRPKETKLCKQITRRLEHDLGEVMQCVYYDDRQVTDVEITDTNHLQLGG